MKPVVIRKVDVTDVLVRETIAHLIRECFHNTGTEWAGKVHYTSGDWWIATEGDVEVAAAGMLPSVRLTQAGYMNCCVVLPSHRGNGLQTRLIKKRIEQARKHGWSQLVTETINDNAASANSLIACGFRQFNPERPWGSPYAVYWRRYL